MNCSKMLPPPIGPVPSDRHRSPRNEALAVQMENAGKPEAHRLAGQIGFGGTLAALVWLGFKISLSQ
jgi:hypothetical protein